MRPHQCQPDSKSDFQAWPAINADLAMANVLAQRIQKLDDEIAALQPQIDAAWTEYSAAVRDISPAVFVAASEQKHDQLVEKEKALMSSRDKLLDKLPGAQPGRAVGLSLSCLS